MYVEAIKTRRNNKIYLTTLIRETFREKGKIKHRTLANISKLPASVIEQIKDALSGKERVAIDELCIHQSKEFGCSFAFSELARDIGLDNIIYSRTLPWRKNAMAMIVGRIVWQGSKLRLTNIYKDSSLWEIYGHDPESQPDVQKACYDVMDKLLTRQKAIQKRLSNQHLDDGCLVLYDITNTWLEGEYANSELAAYGLGKGGKRGYKQIAIGLITNREGCPVAIDVFRGNISDQSTVWGEAKKLAADFGVSNVVLAGDRGMLTPKRIKEVEKIGFKTLTALTHPQMNKVLEKCKIEPGLFDEKQVIEIIDTENNELRYMLCKNPETARRATATRLSLIDAVTHRLNDIAKTKRKRETQKVCSRVGKVFAKYKIEKFFDWNVDEVGRLTFSLKQHIIDAEQALDGCYVIRADVSRDILNKDEVVAGYMALRHVENAFRNLKTVALEMRPVYHKTDDRIRAHVFLCFLSYYLLWHAQQRLKPLFENNQSGNNRRWTFDLVIERLKSIKKEQVTLRDVVVKIIHTTPDAEQNKILSLLGVKMP